MELFKQTPEDRATLYRLWRTQRREVLRKAGLFRNESDEGMAEGLLSTFKAQGYPKTVIRGLADAKRPRTLAKRLREYRRRLGL